MRSAHDNLIIRKATHKDAQACWRIRNQAINNQCEGIYSKKDITIWTKDELSPEFITKGEKPFSMSLSLKTE